MSTIHGNGYLIDPEKAWKSYTTADDTTTTLNTEYPNVIVKGSGVNQWYQCPSAAALSSGYFQIVNASSDIIGVKNSDSTLWLRVLPSQTAVVYLITGGTAAGTWGATLTKIEKDYGFETEDDFICGSTVADYNKSGMYWVASGTAATARPVTVASTHGAATGTQGVFQIATGTDTTGGGYITLYSGSLEAGNGMPLRFYKDRNYISAAADETNDYILRLGFGDAVTNTDPTDGAWLAYDRANHATNWRTGVSGGGSATVADTATAVPIATLFDLNIEIASDSSRVDYWVDRTLIATVTGANVPAAGEQFGMVGSLFKTAGTTSRTFTTDRSGISGARATRRGL
jgi:hypothetical protein